MDYNRRKRHFCHPATQGTLLRRLMRDWGLFVGGSLLVLLAIELVEGGPGRTLDDHVQSLWTRYSAVILYVIALTPPLVYDVVKLSNRFVGPVLRLRRELQRVADGEPPRPLKFREDDHWHELADAYNVAMERLRSSHEANSESPRERDESRHRDEVFACHDVGGHPSNASRW